jgi:uncharacterized membrane protein YhaH (DUF805 family)
VGFTEAVSTCFAKYATFSGRAERPEYWYWVLFNVLVGIVLSLIQLIVSHTSGQVLGVVFDLATILPSIAVVARRLHDTDHSGWWQLLAFVPMIGWIILIVWLCRSGTPGGNRFG